MKTRKVEFRFSEFSLEERAKLEARGFVFDEIGAGGMIWVIPRITPRDHVTKPDR